MQSFVAYKFDIFIFRQTFIFEIASGNFYICRMWLFFFFLYLDPVLYHLARFICNIEKEF